MVASIAMTIAQPPQASASQRLAVSACRPPVRFPLPWIVGTKIPDVTFGIAACVAASAEVIVLDVPNDIPAPEALALA